MSPETSYTFSDNGGDIEALLASYQQAVDRPYALSERQEMPKFAPPTDREEADQDQYDMRSAMYYPNPDGLPLAQVRDIMVAERKRREAAALATPSAPYDGVTPGFMQVSEDKLKRIGWL